MEWVPTARKKNTINAFPQKHTSLGTDNEWYPIMLLIFFVTICIPLCVVVTMFKVFTNYETYLSLVKFLKKDNNVLKMWLVAITWRRHQMEIFSALLAICAGNSPVPGEFPTQRPVTWSFDVFFDLSLNKRLSKQWWGWWFETPSCPLWCHHNDTILFTQEQCERCFISFFMPSLV